MKLSDYLLGRYITMTTAESLLAYLSRHGEKDEPAILSALDISHGTFFNTRKALGDAIRERLIGKRKLYSACPVDDDAKPSTEPDDLTEAGATAPPAEPPAPPEPAPKQTGKVPTRRTVANMEVRNDGGGLFVDVDDWESRIEEIYGADYMGYDSDGDGLYTVSLEDGTEVRYRCIETDDGLLSFRRARRW